MSMSEYEMEFHRITFDLIVYFDSLKNIYFDRLWKRYETLKVCINNKYTYGDTSPDCVMSSKKA